MESWSQKRCVENTTSSLPILQMRALSPRENSRNLLSDGGGPRNQASHLLVQGLSFSC